MAWIQVVDENKATGELSEVYKKIFVERGKVANIMRIHSLNPRVMHTHMELYLAICLVRLV